MIAEILTNMHFIGWLTVIIAVVGMALLIAAFMGYGKALREANKDYSKDSKVIKDGESIVETVTMSRSVKKKEELLKNCETSNLFHAIAEQIIPLLPLLGILGTVWGLFKGLYGMNPKELEMTALLKPMKFALLTTVIGLFSAIVLKILDIVLVVPKIEAINSRIDIIDAQDAQL